MVRGGATNLVLNISTVFSCVELKIQPSSEEIKSIQNFDFTRGYFQQVSTFAYSAGVGWSTTRVI